MTKTRISVHFDGMCWPRLNENFYILSDKLRYRQNSLTKDELIRVSSILDAFDALISKTQKDRNYICKTILELSKEEDAA